MSALRSILHVDMDAFFAAVEQLDDPSLRGKPVLVGHDSGRSVVSTASYEARAFGCRSAMPVAIARRLCPQAIIVPPRFDRYQQISQIVNMILESFSPDVEPVGIDESFIDVTGSTHLFGDGGSIARAIRARIREQVGLTASVGVSFNKFLAKLATDLNKPDGLTIITPENLRATLDPLPISRIWGIGPRSERRLHDCGIRTIGDLRRLDESTLRTHFGEDAVFYRQLAEGIDHRNVTPDRASKSIGQEQTFGRDVIDAETLRAVLLEQTENVSARLRRSGLFASTVTIKLRDGAFKTMTRSRTLDSPTKTTAELWHAALALFDEFARNDFRPIRLIGMSAHNLTPTGGDATLFDQETTSRQAGVDAVVDRINSRFGNHSINRARSTRRRDH